MECRIACGSLGSESAELHNEELVGMVGSKVFGGGAVWVYILLFETRIFAVLIFTVTHVVKEKKKTNLLQISAQ